MQKVFSFSALSTDYLVSQIQEIINEGWDIESCHAFQEIDHSMTRSPEYCYTYKAVVVAHKD